MNNRIAIVTLILACATLLCRAEEAIKRYQVKVVDFVQLNVDNSIPVDYYCDPDSAGMAVLYTTERQADWVIFDNKKNKLSILTDADYPGEGPLPHVIVYSSSLEKVVNSGDSLVKVHNLVPVKKFNATLIGNGRLVAHDVNAQKMEASILSGNGQLVISGDCEQASLKVVGKGTIMADDLKATEEKVSVVGNGTIGCNPIEKLVIKGIGSGSVYYRQTPPKLLNYGMGLKHNAL